MGVESYIVLYNSEFARLAIFKVKSKLKKINYLYRGSFMIIFIACSHEALDGTR